jgi:hypothetical protein
VLDPTVRARLAAVLDEGRVEDVGGARFLPLVELASGARLGLDEVGRWALAEAEATELRPVVPGAERTFVELCEQPRRELEARIEAAAGALGFSADALLASLPSVAIVRSLLGLRSAHVVRLALLWLLPSELRELRVEIAAVAADERHPRAVRELAARLRGAGSTSVE